MNFSSTMTMTFIMNCRGFGGEPITFSIQPTCYFLTQPSGCVLYIKLDGVYCNNPWSKYVKVIFQAILISIVVGRVQHDIRLVPYICMSIMWCSNSAPTNTDSTSHSLFLSWEQGRKIWIPILLNVTTSLVNKKYIFSGKIKTPTKILEREVWLQEHAYFLVLWYFL